MLLRGLAETGMVEAVPLGKVAKDLLFLILLVINVLYFCRNASLSISILNLPLLTLLFPYSFT